MIYVTVYTTQMFYDGKACSGTCRKYGAFEDATEAKEFIADIQEKTIFGNDEYISKALYSEEFIFDAPDEFLSEQAERKEKNNGNTV